MTGALLALFTRALRDDVRAKSMYWARAGLVGIVLFGLGSTRLSMGWTGAPGFVFFNSVTFINLVFITLAGLSYFASAITEEKEEMTLGLLRMTNLNPLSILLGKSASRQVGALLLLVSQLPFTLLAVSLGGVTLSQILAAYACLAAYTVFLGNLALFFSVIMRRTAYAGAASALVLFGFFFGSQIIRYPVYGALNFFQVIESRIPGPSMSAFLDRWRDSTPSVRLAEIGATGFSGSPLCFQVVSNVVLGVLCFLAAWAVFDLFCNEQPDVSPSRGLLRKRGKRGRLFSPGRTWRHALWWKDFHFLGGGHLGTVLKLAIYSGVLGAAFYLPHVFGNNFPRRKDCGYFLLWTMALVLSVEGAFIAARVFRQERIGKTWSSLAALPFSLRRIAYHKIIGCLLATWPAALLMAIGCGLIADEILEGIAETFMRPPRDFSVMAASAFLFGILQTVLFYHLVADLSLRLKWGALPLSIALAYVGTTFMTMIALMMFREAAFVVLSVLAALLTGLLHVDIVRRLHHVAAED